MKLRIHEDYTIHFPIQVCEPLNADFDGDTVSIQLVPPEAAEETYERMSPRYVTIYKKNNEPIYKFNHETLEINWGQSLKRLKISHYCWNRIYS